MIKRFIAWLFSSNPHKRSESILQAFNSANTQLQAVNNDITEEHAKNAQKIGDLQIKNAHLMKTFTKNTSVAANISKLLGEE